MIGKADCANSGSELYGDDLKYHIKDACVNSVGTLRQVAPEVELKAFSSHGRVALVLTTRYCGSYVQVSNAEVSSMAKLRSKRGVSRVA